MNTKLYVGRLSPATTETSLRAAFGLYGTITEIFIASDRDTGRPRGFAFVTFSNEFESRRAAQRLNASDLDGRQICVNASQSHDEVW